MPQAYDDYTFNQLIRPAATEDGLPQILPRRTRYASAEAIDSGLIPVLDYADDLVRPDDYEEVIRDCHERKLFAMYHQDASGVMDAGWNQDGYGYCWAYGITAAVMATRAYEAQEPVRLAPFSLGWLVNWRNSGYYLDGAIKGVRERGIAPASYVPEYELAHRKFKAGWENAALDYRMSEWWDTRKTSDAAMLQQAVTLMRTGHAGYICYYWWSHALMLAGLQWNPRSYLNVDWLLWNSHATNEILVLSGSRAIADELYVVRSTSLPRALDTPDRKVAA